MKKMLTHHTPPKKNERNSQRGQKTHNSKFSLVVILRKILQSSVDHQKPKKRRENSEVFFPFLTFHHPSLCFLSFFLSLRPRNQNSFFFSRAQKQKERD